MHSMHLTNTIVLGCTTHMRWYVSRRLKFHCLRVSFEVCSLAYTLIDKFEDKFVKQYVAQ